MIELKNVWHYYGVRPTLRGIDLEVKTGELMCVMGPNGMGKSTLLAVAGGVQPCLDGYVEINGKRRRRSIQEERALREQVVYLPDTPWLPKSQTGREWLMGVGRLYGVSTKRLFQRIDQLLEVFDLSEQGDRSISSYSTGQQKKIGLCGAFITEAPVLILDEPLSGGLDASALLAVEKILRSLAERHDVTVLMAVPVPELVDRIADRVAVIIDGTLQAIGTPAELCATSGRATLAETLDAMVHPEGDDAVARYLAEGTEDA
ncbi:MAG: ABC transporter ATP-binding protein [Planctomycetota bacterium]